jgi:murein DD-endopeptidase MepM/ murein hydrolase activator NlpD
VAPAAPEVAAGDPVPDARGVIAYPDYQVVVARDGDSLDSIAARIGIPTAELASYNGLPTTWRPRGGDTLVVPPGVARAPVAPAPVAPAPVRPPVVATPTPATPGPQGWSPDIVTAAIDRAETEPAPTPRTPGLGPLSEPQATPAPVAPAEVPAAADPLAEPGTAPLEPAPEFEPVTPAPVALPDAPAPVTPPGTELAGAEPLRHTVAPGETIYAIGRLYGVPVTSIAAWNGLGRDYTLRPGQVVLIPLAASPAEAAPAPVTVPGTPSPVSTPPSAVEPLPPSPPVAALPPSPNLEQYRTDTANPPRLLTPVTGPVARPYSKGGPDRNDGIDILAAAGTQVLAADEGEVALISNSLGGLGKIVLIRHAGGLTTVYGRVDNVTVAKGDRVARGQVIGEVAATQTPSLHFEVRRGAESVDPAGYL